MSIFTLYIAKNIFKSLETSLNKRPMGHIAHLRKQFKSLNKFDSEKKEKTL